MYQPNLKSVALPIPAIIAGTDKLWAAKIIDFGTNRKSVCDFLLVPQSNLGPTCTVSEILQVFLCS